MDVTRREATLDDVPSLEIVRSQALEHGLTAVYDRADVAHRVASGNSSLHDWIDSEEHLVTVIESEVTVLSYGVYHYPEARVQGIYTAPAYQREGWGTRLLDRLVAAARRSCEATIQTTAPHNAVPFFEANGFEIEGRGREDGIEMTELRRSLAEPRASSSRRFQAGHMVSGDVPAEMVVAIVRPEKLSDVKQALAAADAPSLTVTDASGRGSQPAEKGNWHGEEYIVDLHQKVKIESVVEPDLVDDVVDAIADAAHTGKQGDGKIFVLPVTDVVQIRNEARGADAL